MKGRRRTKHPTTGNPPEVPPGCSAVPLTHGAWATVSTSRLPEVLLHTWYLHVDGYACSWIDGKSVLMHRFLTAALPGQLVDHRNDDGSSSKLNNADWNLRVCTHAQNRCNMSAPSNNTSGFKGVHFDVTKNWFRARIGHGGKKINLGVFATAEQAAVAYNAAALKLHGEFARLNKIPKAA